MKEEMSKTKIKGVTKEQKQVLEQLGQDTVLEMLQYPLGRKRPPSVLHTPCAEGMTIC
jgi:hypothetical protein